MIPLLSNNSRCSTDQIIVPDLTYNPQNNLAYSEVSVFKFADKVRLLNERNGEEEKKVGGANF